MDTGLAGRFQRGLALAPDRPAIRDGGRTCSYRELHEHALDRAGALLGRRSEPPRAVGVLAAKSIEGYAGVLAALYTGVPVVPLHPDFPVERTRQLIQAAGVEAVLADQPGHRVLAQLAGAGVDVPAVELSAVSSGTSLTAARAAGPDDVAYVLFTSGSTGRPKGVPITHASLRHYFRLMDERYDFTPQDVFSQTFDLNFDCAMFDLFCAWGAGACVHPVPATAYLDLPAFLAERGTTVWFATPSSIALVRKMTGLAPGALPGLRWSLFAGEALPADGAAEWQAAAPDSVLENIYGPTELTITVTGYRWRPESSPAACVNGLVPIGRVHAGHEWFLAGPDGERTRGEGELWISGPQLTPGYLDPADDAGRIVPREGRTWYRTGDRVRELPGGELVYLGRLDSQVQVQGRRVELAEVEHAVRSCDGVTDAVTVARSVDGRTELVVFYTASRAGPLIGPAELTGRLRRILPPGTLPREYRLLDRFPLNSNRKIDRGQLAREAAVESARPLHAG